MSYSELLEQLYRVNMFNGVKLGLETMNHFHSLLDRPADAYKTIHIAGTNGKGSVAVKIAKTLELAGYKVGLYTSPHLHTYRERIQVNGQLISESDVAEGLKAIFDLTDREGVTPTFFEITTLLGFLHFKKQKVDYAVIETGLGGRLDATNIITPAVSVITSISLEHTKILGATIEKITQEKAGILKPGVPSVIGHTVPLAGRVEEEFESPEEENKHLAKMAVGLLQLNLSDALIEEGIAHRPPCRLEHRVVDGVPVLFDVAHNPAALEALYREVERVYGAKPIVTAYQLGREKEIESCERVIDGKSAAVHYLDVAHPRLMRRERNGDGDGDGGRVRGRGCSSIGAALKEAREMKGVLVVAGSFFIMSEVMEELGMYVERDVLVMQENFVAV